MDVQIVSSKEVLGEELNIYGTIEEPLFLAKDVAEWIGHSKVSMMLKSVDDDEKVKVNNVYVEGRTGGDGVWFLTEDGLYEVLFQSRKPIAKAFKKEVKAILKQLRKTGVYMNENATSEAILFEDKYGIKRIRKTFRESSDIEKDWQEFKILSKQERNSKRLNNLDRIKRCTIIVDELENIVANNITNFRASKVLLYRELIGEIKDERQRLTNKYYGGVLSSKTKEIKKLEQQVEEYRPRELIYTTVDSHGFSHNYMYEPGLLKTVRRTRAYNNWINNFPCYQVPKKEDYEVFEGIDFTKPIGVDIRYVCKADVDIRNLDKATLDMIFNRCLGVDDNIIAEVKSARVGTVNSYDEGQIIFAIYNLD